MVDVHLRDGELEVEVKGLHQLWALRRHVRVPIHAVTAVRRLAPDEVAGWWKGWRAPGTHLPGVIVAGTFYKDGERHFWDVVRGDRAIEIDVDGGSYHRLFVEVADPDDAIRRIETARAVTP